SKAHPMRYSSAVSLSAAYRSRLRKPLVILFPMRLPRNLRPMRLSRRIEPFDSDDYIFELKIDGFRSLAYIENGQCDLVSRNGNTFRNFKDLAQWIGENLTVENAVIDSEIACIDGLGRSVFNDLLFRRRECLFFAFDLLFL